MGSSCTSNLSSQPDRRSPLPRVRHLLNDRQLSTFPFITSYPIHYLVSRCSIQTSAFSRPSRYIRKRRPAFSNCNIACVQINYSELIESGGGVLPCIQRSPCCCWLDFPVPIGCSKSNANYVAPSTNHGKVCRRKRSVRTEIQYKGASFCPEMRMAPGTSSQTVP